MGHPDRDDGRRYRYGRGHNHDPRSPFVRQPRVSRAIKSVHKAILEIGQLMTVFIVHHTTTYRYKQPVRLGSHQLLFRPRDSFDQRLLDCQLKVTPEPVDIRWIHDVFGNCVTLVDFNSSCQILEFETTIRLDHSPGSVPDFRIENYARFHPFNYAEEEVPDLAAYIRRHHAEDGEVEAWLAKFLSKASQPTGQLLMTLNEAIAESFSYRRRALKGRKHRLRQFEARPALAGTWRC